MRCDKVNNNKQCGYDGGDCCLSTCLRICNISNYQDSQCPCYSYALDCQDPNASCYQCNLTHATCQPTSKCLVGPQTNPNLYIIQNLEVCMVNGLSMGNYRTINTFCGQDPNYKVVHDNTPGLHFPGCGLTLTQCTVLPCCDDALVRSQFQLVQRYSFRNGSCNSTVATYNLFSPATFSDTSQTTNCITYFTNCFTTVMKDKGQCCQCNKGWTGFDCNTPVCNPPCVYGTCVDSYTCSCFTGWTGPICSIGICSDCHFGVCSAPNVCECFYGYTGPNCRTPVSDPPCVNGIATAPNNCTCNIGWTGPLCDVPDCPQGCGHGYCVDGQVCECYQGYYTSYYNVSECDAIDCKTYHPQCIHCNFTSCVECNSQWVLAKNGLSCQSCQALYGPLCIGCDSNSCNECYWPYFYDYVANACVSNGHLEFSVPMIAIKETNYSIVVIVRRTFETVGQVTVDFELQQTSPLYSRLEDSRGTLVFPDGVEEQTITLRIFKRQYYELDDYLTTFMIQLYNPSFNTEIGVNSKLIIQYYDDELTMNDAAATTISLNNAFNTQSQQAILIGSNNNFQITSNYYYNMPKALGNDLFIARFLYQNGTEAMVLQSYQIGALSSYQISFVLQSLDIAIAKIYATSTGFTMKYYDNTNFMSIPFIQRIEDHLPFNFTNDIRRISYFSLRMESIIIFDIFPPGTLNVQEAVTFNVAMGDKAMADIYWGTDLVFTTNPYNCHGMYLTVDTKCCKEQKSFIVPKIDLTGQVPYYLRIDYRQKGGVPCINITRSSPNMTYADLSLNSYSITELKASPFFIEPVVNILEISIAHSSKRLYGYHYSTLYRSFCQHKYQCVHLVDVPISERLKLTHRYSL